EAGPIVLSMLKAGIGAFLDRLGADDDALTEDHRAIAAATGAQLYSDLLQAPEAGAAARELIPDGAAFVTGTEELGVYRPKATHSFGAAARAARKKDEGNGDR